MSAHSPLPWIVAFKAANATLLVAFGITLLLGPTPSTIAPFYVTRSVMENATSSYGAVVSLTFASWNQIDSWLRQVVELRQVA